MLTSLDVDEERAEEPYQPLCVLKFSEVYPYTIPSFAVNTVQLRHAFVQGEDDDGRLKVADAFFREDTTLLSVPTPKLLNMAALSTNYVKEKEWKHNLLYVY